MTTHCSSLAWRIPWAEKPGGLQSTDWQRVRHDYVIKHTKAFRMMVLGWNPLKGIDNKSCEAALCYICEFFHWNIVLPAGARHFTWNSAYCSVLSSKTFSVLFLSLCRKSIRRETSHDVMVLFCERLFYTCRNVPSNFWWNPIRGNLHHPLLTFTLWKFETIRVLPI